MIPVVLLVMIGLVILFFAGPRVSVEMNIRPLELPEDLDNYLQTSESQISDILPNTGKTIIWADPAKKDKTPVSIAYLPGFSATRQETAPLSDIIAKKLGANLFYTRLTGHGRDSQAMGKATTNDWLNDTVEALEIGWRIGEKVIIIGTSTGGTLATWLAAFERSDDILAYILISPNFMPNKSIAKLLTWPWAKYLLPLMFGKTYRWKPKNLRHGQYWTTSHPVDAVFQMMALVQFVRNTDLSKIQTPALFFLSRQDRLVNPKETENIYDRFGSSVKKKVYIDNSQDPNHHVIAGEILSPNTTEPIAQMILDFVTPLL